MPLCSGLFIRVISWFFVEDGGIRQKNKVLLYYCNNKATWQSSDTQPWKAMLLIERDCAPPVLWFLCQCCNRPASCYHLLSQHHNENYVADQQYLEVPFTLSLTALCFLLLFSTYMEGLQGNLFVACAVVRCSRQLGQCSCEQLSALTI